MVIAAGPGPWWVRWALTALAGIYFLMLLHRPPESTVLRPVTFFTEATCLFPGASTFAIEYRLEAWTCGRRWVALDPRPYFQIQPDDKESRLQRLGHFYDHNHAAMAALDAYIMAGHAAGTDDAVTGPIGGIRLVKVVRPFPKPGEPVERYRFEPLAPVPTDQRREGYTTPAGERKRRCEGQ
jgi:hypothetical protein